MYDKIHYKLKKKKMQIKLVSANSKHDGLSL